MDWGAGRSAWVRVWDDAGRCGLGEASPMGGGDAALEVVAGLFARALVGSDPLDHAVLQDRLFHQHAKLGPDGVLAAALAAVDIALWDLKGRSWPTDGRLARHGSRGDDRCRLDVTARP